MGRRHFENCFEESPCILCYTTEEERASHLESILYRHSCFLVSFYKCCGSAGLERVLRGSTCGRVHVTLDQVLILVNPFAVALEVDLSGRGWAAGEGHWLVLNDINIIRLQQEVWQQVGEGRRKWMRHSGRMLSACESKLDKTLKTGCSCSDAFNLLVVQRDNERIWFNFILRALWADRLLLTCTWVQY